MKRKTRVKAGGMNMQHNQVPTPRKAMKLKTAIRAGDPPCKPPDCGPNHNQALATPPRKSPPKLKTAIKAKSGVKAGQEVGGKGA